jgi:hypothetical protein
MTTTTKKKASKKKAAGTKKAAKKKAIKKSIKPKKLDTSLIEITLEERWKMIAVAAYHKAEKRGFASGNELQDWTESEKEIDALLFG